MLRQLIEVVQHLETLIYIETYGTLSFWVSQVPKFPNYKNGSVKVQVILEPMMYE